MRPINKKSPGETVRYMDSHGNYINHTIQSDYNPYKKAKMPLIGNIERYCSYCEGLNEVDALAVEHIDPKGKGGSTTKWQNFLLCCTECNSLKGSAVPSEDCHWPHQNNTLLDFVYDETGRIKVNTELPQLSQKRATALYNLLKLGRIKETTTDTDFRWIRRYETWNKAKTARLNYEQGKWDADDIIGRAKENGHWSVWFTVFAGVDEILRRLIYDFQGTCKECFDSNNHYRPIYRNPDCIEDPV